MVRVIQDRRIERALKWAKQVEIIFMTKEGRKLFKETIKQMEKKLKKANDI